MNIAEITIWNKAENVNSTCIIIQCCKIKKYFSDELKIITSLSRNYRNEIKKKLTVKKEI